MGKVSDGAVTERRKSVQGGTGAVGYRDSTLANRSALFVWSPFPNLIIS
jgi:hypothetical protein